MGGVHSGRHSTCRYSLGVRHAPLREPVYCGDTVEELLDFSAFADELSPAFGPVHRVEDGEYRWIVLDSATLWPPATDPVADPAFAARIGDRLLTAVCNARFRHAASCMQLDVCGWMFTASGPLAPIYPSGAAGPATGLQDARYCLGGHYLHVDSGAITTRVQTAGNVDIVTQPLPADGWDPGKDGSVRAALGICRTLTLARMHGATAG